VALEKASITVWLNVVHGKVKVKLQKWNILYMMEMY